MKHWNRLLFFIIILSSVSFAQELPVDFSFLMQKSDVIIKAKVEQTETRWVTDSRGKHIYTYATLSVDKVLKGSGVGSNVTIEVPGGKVGEITEVVSNSFPVRKNEEYVFFLHSYPYRVVNENQGRFSVYQNKIYLKDRQYEAGQFISVIEDALKRSVDIKNVDDVIKAIGEKNSAWGEVTPDFKKMDKVPVLSSGGSFPAKIDQAKKVLAAADLAPYKPDEWGAQIIVRNVVLANPAPAGSFTADDSPLYNNTTLYAAFCYANYGTLTSGTFNITVFIDGVLKTTIAANDVSPSNYTYYFNVSLGILTTGSHTITVNLDSDNGVAESNEGNNSFTKTITVTAAGVVEPNLVPYKPSFMADKIVVKNATITDPNTQLSTDSSPLMDSDNLYVALAINNSGTAVANASNVKIYVDNVYVTQQNVAAINQGEYRYYWNISLGSFAQGSHTIKIVADADAQVTESNEGDNEYSKSIDIQHLAGTPTITSISPGSASAGTGTSITITGTGFGAAKGTSKVEFFYRAAQPKMEATEFTSWSDNQIVCNVPIGEIGGYSGSAGSGPVTVTTLGGTSNGYNFTVTFSYGGQKWSGSPAVVPLRINENTSDLVGEGAQILAAASTWTSAGASFQFTNDGTTAVTNASNDGINEILFGTTGGSLATASYWFIGSSMTEADIVFNDGYTWSSDGSAYDVQSIALHEFGHWLNLRDLYGSTDNTKVMYGFGYSGTTKRALTAEDAAGIQWIYGGGAAVTPPTAASSAATGVSSTSATLNGTVNANGSSTTVYFQYGTTTGYGSTVNAAQTPVSGSSNTSVSASVTGLSQGTTYHYRVVANNLGGTVYGTDQTFTTTSAPAAATNAATSINTSGAVLNGTVNANNLSTAVTFEYGLTTSYGSTITATQSPVTGSSNTAVSATVSGLTPGTSYHFRVVAVNSAGTTNGSDQNFTTTANPPTVTINSATLVTSRGARLNGTVNPNSTTTNATFEYGTTTVYGSTKAADQGPLTGSSATSVSTTLSGLTPNTLYHYRITAVNVGGTVSSADSTFRTLQLVPTNIALTSGNNQSQKINTVLTNPFVVTITDPSGELVAGVPVTFAIATVPTNASGQALSVTNATTNASGQASTVLTLGNKKGTYTVTATSAGLAGSPITFTVTCTAGNPAFITATSGNNQSGKISTTVTNPYVVTITDAGGNTVQGAAVSFSVSSAPSGAIGYDISPATVTTNANGEASASLTFGTKPGNYVVTATVSGLTGSSAVFTSTAISGTAKTIALTSGNNQTALISTALTNPFVVTVTDQDGNPVQGVAVTYAIAANPAEASGQALSASTSTTDASGRASSILTFGNKVGTYTVTASVSGLTNSPITFSAVATSGPATSILGTSGNNQNVPIGSSASSPLIVTVTDAGGNPVQGIVVNFSVTSSPSGATGYTLSITSGTTNALGQVSTILTVGNKSGAYVVTAVIPGISTSPITFTITANSGTAAAIALTSGNNQSGAIGGTLSPFIVTVTDAGSNPVPGIVVSFAVASVPTGAAGQILSVNSSTTNSSGQASVVLTLGNKPGAYTVTASSSGLNGSPATFTATAQAGSASLISLTSGNNQSGQINSALTNPFIVTVTDAGGNPVSGAAVSFAIGSTPAGAAGQVLSVTSSTTNSSGQASTILTLGNKAGSYTVTASLSGLTGSPVTFTATAQAGGASLITLTSGNNQTGQILSVLPNQFIVTVTDAGGNPVSGAWVNFAVATKPDGATGQSVGSPGSMLNSSGQASSTFTLGNKVGTYTVTATFLGVPGSPVTFSATATAGSAAAIVLTSGNDQNAQTGSALASPFIVTVTDAGGNPVSGASVQFAISSSPTGAAGQVLSVTNTATNSSGQASTVLTLGNKEGNYAVTASSSGLSGSPVTFTALAKPAVGVTENEKPKEYSLGQNYPNPFNPSTRIEYNVTENAIVNIKVYNTLGVEVSTLINRFQTPGRYSVDWDPGDNPGGLYLYVMKTNKYTETRKMLYLK